MFFLVWYPLDCFSADPLPAVTSGTRDWNNMYSYGTPVTYTCADGITLSHAYCRGDVWSYTVGATNCYDGTPPVPPCDINIVDASGTISSTDPQYQGCTVNIIASGALLTLTTTKFKVLMPEAWWIVTWAIKKLGSITEYWGGQNIFWFFVITPGKLFQGALVGHVYLSIY